MKINIGTKNKAKLQAVEEILKEYLHLAEAKCEGIEVESGVSAQPLSLEETVRGAINRARASFFARSEPASGGEVPTYSIGIESGLMQVPGSKSGHMDVCVCAIYDGKEVHLGLSSAWEFPDKRVMNLMLKEGLDMNQAAYKVGLTENEKVGSAEGSIGILTKGRLDRKEYTKQALRTALIHLEP